MRLGERGEGYVVGQFALLGLLVLALWVTPSFSPPWLGAGAGAGLGGAGGAAAGGLATGPQPDRPAQTQAGGYLVQQGLYRVVRHPIYCGVLLWALGSSLAHLNLWTLLLCGLLFVWLDRKASPRKPGFKSASPSTAPTANGSKS